LNEFIESKKIKKLSLLSFKFKRMFNAEEQKGVQENQSNELLQNKLSERSKLVD